MQRLEDITDEQDVYFLPQEIVTKKCIEILKKAPVERSEIEMLILMRYFSTLEILTKFNSESRDKTIRNICYYAEYEYGEAGKNIIEESTYGTKFYIIIQGKVEVFINSHQGKENTLVKLKVSELGPGQSFGELALMNRFLKKRSATISCLENCHFACLPRDSFLRFLGSIKGEISQQLEYLCQHELFSKKFWSDRQLTQWIKLFEFEYRLPRNHVIFKEGDMCDKVYFAKSGQVVCTKMIEIEVEKKTIDELDLNKMNIMTQKFKLPEKMIKKEFQITVLNQMSFFGDEEAYEWYKHQDNMNAQREKYMKEFKKKLNKEQSKGTVSSVTDSQSLSTLQKDDEDDEQFLDRLVNEKLFKNNTSIVRKASYKVWSNEAEIWSINTKSFFDMMKIIPEVFEKLKSLIEQKNVAFEERIENCKTNTKNFPQFFTNRPINLTPPNRLHKQKKIIYKQSDKNIFIKPKSKTRSKKNLLNQSLNLSTQQAERSPLPIPTSQTNKTIKIKLFEDLKTTPHRIKSKNDDVMEASNLKTDTNFTQNSFFKTQHSIKTDETPVMKKLVIPSIFKNAIEKLTFDKKPQDIQGNQLTIKTTMDNFKKTPKSILKDKSPILERSCITESNQEDSVLMLENPLRGLSYAANFAYQEKVLISEKAQDGQRITGRKIDEYKNLNASQYLRTRLEHKKQFQQDNFSKSPKKVNPLFTRTDLLNSDQNFRETLVESKKFMARKEIFFPGLQKRQNSASPEKSIDISCLKTFEEIDEEPFETEDFLTTEFGETLNTRQSNLKRYYDENVDLSTLYTENQSYKKQRSRKFRVMVKTRLEPVGLEREKSNSSFLNSLSKTQNQSYIDVEENSPENQEKILYFSKMLKIFDNYSFKDHSVKNHQKLRHTSLQRRIKK